MNEPPSARALAAPAGGGSQRPGPRPPGAPRPSAGLTAEPPPLSAYVPRLALDWLAAEPQERHRRVEGALAFVDVSGFTALTERLAARGRAGAEEITDIVGATFAELAGTAFAYGADLLKWGGDAALLLYTGEQATARAARSSWSMVRAMRRVGRLRTSAGRVELQVSVGVHSGMIELFLVGEAHRELVVAGPAATRTAVMEELASAGQVVLSAASAGELVHAGQGEVIGPAASGGGFVLAGEPAADEQPARRPRLAGAADSAGQAAAALLLPEPTRRHLLAAGEQAEHRPVAVGFVQLGGLDALIGASGPAAAVEHLEALVGAAARAADGHGVSFHATDIAVDGFKLLLLGGVPEAHGDDADRVVRACLEIVRPEPGAQPARRSPGKQDGDGSAASSLLALRAAVHCGKIFVFASELGLAGRRLYSVTGDAVNLTARAVAMAAAGELRCTEPVRASLRTRLELCPLPPFAAKGKSEPVVTYAVEGPLDSGSPGAAAPAAGGRAAPFVGREEEVAALLAAARAAGGGDGKVVEIVGAAGIGKSRLVDEAAAAWRLTTWRVSCDAFRAARPYRPLRATARRLLGLEDTSEAGLVAEVLTVTLRRHAPQLLGLAPLLGEVLGAGMQATAEVEAIEPRFRQRRLESAFVELMAILVAGPLALVFEDAHALDGASASLLLRICDEAAERPWLVVATRRPDRPGVPEGELADRLVLDLAGLPSEAASALLAAVDDDTLAPAARRLLVERAAGNPLFLQELVRAALADGSTEELPEALEPLLAAQVDRLSPPDRRVLRSAAVLGQRFDDALLAELLDYPGLLDEALWARLADFVTAEGGARAFTHALVRDAAYEGLSFRRRRELHARAAAAIERRPHDAAEGAELLAWHWLAAERWEPAWSNACLAGERAAAMSANADAARQFRRALQAARHLPALPASELVRVGEMLGDAAELAGDYEAARLAYAGARRRAAAELDRARLARKAGVLLERQGRYPQALRWYATGRRHLERLAAGIDAAPERVELTLATAGVRHRQARLRQSRQLAAAARAEAERIGDRRGVAHGLYLEHLNSVFLNEPRDELGLAALPILEELGDLVRRGNALNNLGISAYFRGEWDEALRCYAASREDRERGGDLMGAAMASHNTGEILYDQGRVEEAEACFGDARRSWRAARYRVGELLALTNLGRLAARRGDAAMGEELLERARAGFEAIHAGPYVAGTEVYLLEAALAAGDAERAEALAAGLAARCAGQPGLERAHAGALRGRGSALAALGLAEEAAAILDDSVACWESLGDSFELARALAARAAVRRRLAAAGTAAEVSAADADEAEARRRFGQLGVTDAAIEEHLGG